MTAVLCLAEVRGARNGLHSPASFCLLNAPRCSSHKSSTSSEKPKSVTPDRIESTRDARTDSHPSGIVGEYLTQHNLRLYDHKRRNPNVTGKVAFWPIASRHPNRQIAPKSP